MAATIAPAAPAVVTSDPRVPGHSIVDWAIDLLAALREPVTPANVQALTIWANHESGGYRPGNPVGLYNPLNTTEGALGFAAQGGAQGNIKGFASYAQGIAAQSYNLTHTRGAGYENILAALAKGNDPNAVLRAINASSFGTHGLPTNLSPATSVPAHTTNGTVVDTGTQTVSIAGDAEKAAADAFSGLIDPLFPGLHLGSGALGAAGGVGGALSAAQSVAAVVIKVISDWRFIAEVIGGAVLVLLGVRLIVADTTGRTVVPRAAQAAPLALAAAA